MKWNKINNHISPFRELWWSQHYCILPTPVYLEKKNVLRIFFATTADDLIGRVVYLDFDPVSLEKISIEPVWAMDRGEQGAFDESGVNPSSILKVSGGWILYYLGYQKHQTVPFSLFSGAATSEDCSNFVRVSSVPILERTNLELNLRSAPTILHEDGKYYMWYVSSLGWCQMREDSVHGKKLMPRYCIRRSVSDDGINWSDGSDPIFIHKENEFGFGRPWIYKGVGIYYLFYSIRTIFESYRIGYATSADLVCWERRDTDVGIDVSAEGWDSEMICYASVVKVLDKTIMVYNGNENGKGGFGFAVLDGTL